MSKPYPAPSSLTEDYVPPTSLKQAHARLKFAAKELAGGSVHRAIDVLQVGCCELPTSAFSEDLDVTYAPPELSWTVDLPHKLKVADRKLQAALSVLDGPGVRAALDVLRRRQDVQPLNG